MWGFVFHSLFREYGWQFLLRLVLPHPLRTAGAVLRAAALDVSGHVTAIPGGDSSRCPHGAPSILGVGFCMKPIDPPCLSGRANHDCRYLERLHPCAASGLPECCGTCDVRRIGVMALDTGAAFYIMTSARDILLDVFVPALNEGTFPTGLFVLCRYSLRPFAAGLMASGMHARLFPFEKGDCRDYATWLQADRGIKEERTEISGPNRSTIRELCAQAVTGRFFDVRFEKRGNVLYPRLPAESPGGRAGQPPPASR
jgi:hypothetical protein